MQVIIFFVGAINLTGSIPRLRKGLIHLNLAHCGLTCKGVNQLSQSFTANNVHNTLTFLSLSGNCLKDDISVSMLKKSIYLDKVTNVLISEFVQFSESSK